MDHDRILELLVATGRDRSDLAHLLGYASDNSLRQIEAGRQTLPEAKVKWLVNYARLRQRLAKEETEWLDKHPVPTDDARFRKNRT